MSACAASKSAVSCALASASVAREASELARRDSSAADLAFASATWLESSLRAASTLAAAVYWLKKYMATSPTPRPMISDVITQPQNLLSCMRMYAIRRLPSGPCRPLMFPIIIV